MPVASYKPTTPTQVVTSQPVIIDVKGNSPVVDSKRIPLHTLITFVEGSNYVVDFFNQILTSDSSTYAQDTSQSAQYQQYRKINRLEIKVTAPLTETQNEENRQFTVQGTGIVHSLITPNEGDMFAADVGNGREGVFQVDSARQLSIRSESAYEIRFTLLYFSDAEPTRRADLEKKSVLDLHYMSEFAQSGQDPLVSTREFATIQVLHSRYQQLVDNYLRWFWSREFGTLVVPGQEHRVYDGFVPKFLRTILEVDEHHQLLKMQLLNLDEDNALQEPQLYECLARRDLAMLRASVKKMGVASTKQFSRDPMHAGIRFSGFDYVTYPMLLNNPIDHHHNQLAKIPTDEFVLQAVSSLAGNIDTIAEVGFFKLTPTTQIPLIHPVLKDAYYVFSEAFYENKPGKSLLEVLTENYLQREDNRPEAVLQLVDSIPKWGGLERFYYAPVVMLLIKAVLKDY